MPTVLLASTNILSVSKVIQSFLSSLKSIIALSNTRTKFRIVTFSILNVSYNVFLSFRNIIRLYFIQEYHTEMVNHSFFKAYFILYTRFFVCQNRKLNGRDQKLKKIVIFNFLQTTEALASSVYSTTAPYNGYELFL